MRRLILIPVVAALAASALTATAARAIAPPQLHAVARPDGTVHASWVVPAGEKMMEFLYDTSGKLASIGQFANPGDVGCGAGNWCWPGRGIPLYCYYVLYHDRTGDCPGHSDLGDRQASIDVGPLPKGTYFLQVTAMDQCVGESSPCGYPDEYWSNVVQVTVDPAKSPGGGQVAQSGKVVRSQGTPKRIAVGGGGTLVLDRWGTIAFEGRTPAVWQLQRGRAYLRGAAGRRVGTVIDGRFTETWVCCGAAAVVSVGPAGDTIGVVAGGAGAPATGPVLVMAKGSGRIGTGLKAGQQVTERGRTAAAFGTARVKRFVPTRSFWK